MIHSNAATEILVMSISHWTKQASHGISTSWDCIKSWTLIDCSWHTMKSMRVSTLLRTSWRIGSLNFIQILYNLKSKCMTITWWPSRQTMHSEMHSNMWQLGWLLYTEVVCTPFLDRNHRLLCVPSSGVKRAYERLCSSCPLTILF